jgi:hypothetical protein
MTIKMPYIVKPGNGLPPTRSGDDKKAEAFIAAASLDQRSGARGAAQADGNAGKAVVNMRFDAGLLSRIDAAARRQGISRTAWLHVAASKALEGDMPPPAAAAVMYRASRSRETNGSS